MTLSSCCSLNLSHSLHAQAPGTGSATYGIWQFVLSTQGSHCHTQAPWKNSSKIRIIIGRLCSLLQRQPPFLFLGSNSLGFARFRKSTPHHVQHRFPCTHGARRPRRHTHTAKVCKNASPTGVADTARVRGSARGDGDELVKTSLSRRAANQQPWRALQQGLTAERGLDQAALFDARRLQRLQLKRCQPLLPRLPCWCC